ALAFSPDGQWLATGDSRNMVGLWDLKTGRQLQAFTEHRAHVKYLSFSCDGQLLASASDDGTVGLWRRAAAPKPEPPTPKPEPPAPKAGEVRTLDLGGGVTMEVVGIPPGEFLMGSTKEEQAWAARNGCPETLVKGEGEAPRKTRIKDGFWLGRTEVTVGQWKQFVAATGYKTDAEEKGFADYAYDRQRKVMAFNVTGGSWINPGFDQQDKHPVGCVSWNDAMAFCQWLTEREQKAGRLSAGQAIRLPTEAEWEYACRAGTTGKWWWGDVEKEGEGRLNWKGTEDGFEGTSPVDHYGERGRNGFGLPDMLGNVWEWCLDEYGPAAAPEAASKAGPSRVIRGGMLDNFPSIVRCATRSPYDPTHSHSGIGFRVAVAVGVSDAFVKEVAALPAQEQVKRVVAKLKELNPGFDPATVKRNFENRVATFLQFSAVGVTDISPIRALSGLGTLNCSGSESQRSPLADLTPLAGLPLTRLNCTHVQVSDLGALKGMRLVGLNCAHSQVRDLSPLEGMPLEGLNCAATSVSDLSPLRGMPLRSLMCYQTAVSDLEPLRGMPLTQLSIFGTKVADLSPLKDLPLTKLHLDFKPQRDTEVVRSIKTLEDINGWPTEEFWSQVSKGVVPKLRLPARVPSSAAPPVDDAFVREVAALPPAPKPGAKSYDDVYVATAAMAGRIPHPLSRKTYKVKHGAQTVEVPEGMVFVPGGKFLMGDNTEPAARPAHEVDVKPFFIDKYEVTNAQYMEFVKATGHRMPSYVKRNAGNIPEGRENHPVTCVAWADAAAYATWCGKRLPTE
ncbi:MAG: hypothetical protein FJ278_12310, partial [Planctomycetes bacterium]|nr:hypothetical protein [Planctomycetota bacterium]